MRYLSENFWRHSWDVSTLFLKKIGLFVCLSVCYFAHFLTEIRQIWGYLLFLMRYLFEIFLRHSWGDCTLVWNTWKFLYVCQSVSWLTYLLKWGQYRNISCPRWDIFLKFFGDIPWMFLHHFPIIKNCLYVC